MIRLNHHFLKHRNRCKRSRKRNEEAVVTDDEERRVEWQRDAIDNAFSARAFFLSRARPRSTGRGQAAASWPAAHLACAHSFPGRKLAPRHRSSSPYTTCVAPVPLPRFFLCFASFFAKAPCRDMIVIVIRENAIRKCIMPLLARIQRLRCQTCCRIASDRSINNTACTLSCHIRSNSSAFTFPY